MHKALRIGTVAGTILLLLGSSGLTAAKVTRSSVCGVWSVVPSPNQGRGDNALGAVAAISANDVWAVGSRGIGSSGITASLADHWNGTNWSVVPSPNVGTLSNALYGVSGVAPDDVWAVGNYMDDSTFNSHTLFEHWDGARWTVVAGPNPGALINVLNGVSADASFDAWAVGHYSDDGNAFRSVVMHWDGESWRVVPNPNPGLSDLLYGVKALAPDNVWVVGQSSGASTPDETLVEHWNGSRWSIIASGNARDRSDTLYGVDASGSNQYAVGESESSTEPKDTLTERFDGASWYVTPSANAAPGDNILFGVGAVSASDAWAVGNSVGSSDNDQTLIERWNGSAWSIVDSPNPGGNAGNNILGGVAVISPHDVWAVGGYDTGGNTLSLTLHYC